MGYKNLKHVDKKHLLTTIRLSSPSRWKLFWSLKIPSNARNTWYRIIHDKVTTSSLLHSRGITFNSSEPVSSCCRICISHNPESQNIEDIEHFLFSCPYKLQIWQTALSLYGSPFLLCSFENFKELLHLSQPTHLRCSDFYRDLTLYQVFATILQAIWHYHYKYIYEDLNFSPPIVLKHIQRSLLTLQNQITYQSYA